MWTSMASVALALSCAPQILLVASRGVQPRQEQCESAPNDAAAAACAMQAAFGGSAIIPELLPNFSPKAALFVTYGNVVLGGAQQLSPAKVFAQPSLSMAFISNSSQAFQKSYAVMGLSYQAPSNVKLFWLQGGLKVDSTTGAMSSATNPIVKYLSPNPTARTGTNEYIFFVFQDPGLNLITKDSQSAGLTSNTFDLRVFQSAISPGIIAGSYFKSIFDGLPINGQAPGQAPSPAPLQVPQIRQVSSNPQVGTPAPNISTNGTVSPQVQNATTALPSTQGTYTNGTTAIPTQVIRPAAHTDGFNQTNSTSSSSSTFMNVKALRPLFAAALFSASFL